MFTWCSEPERGHSRNSVKLASLFDVLSPAILLSGLPPSPRKSLALWSPAAFIEALHYRLPEAGVPCLTPIQLLHVLGNPGKAQLQPLTPGIGVEG